MKTVNAKLIEFVGIGDRPVFQWVVECCPYCGRRHHHGAGKDPKKIRSTLNHRVPHCKPGVNKENGYILRSNDMATLTQIEKRVSQIEAQTSQTREPVRLQIIFYGSGPLPPTRDLGDIICEYIRFNETDENKAFDQQLEENAQKIRESRIV